MTRHAALPLAAPRPALRLVPPPPRASAAGLYALGLSVGFVLVALVSAPTGGGASALVLAAVAGVAAAVLGRRGRTSRRRSAGTRRAHRAAPAARRTAAPAAVPLRRAA